jgi:hypothetical protein
MMVAMAILVAVRNGGVVVPFAHCETRACPGHDQDAALHTAAQSLGIDLGALRELAEQAPGQRRDGAQ